MAKKCQDLNLPLIGNIPLDARICSDADSGRPTVVAEGGEEEDDDDDKKKGENVVSERRAAFEGVAREVRRFLEV